jgi:PmbA protein
VEADGRLPEALAERLSRRASVDGAAVAEWRFDLAVGWSIQIGLKNGELGGPYEPPAAAHGTAGRLYVRWSDGACSNGKLDAHTLEAWDERLAEWRANAFADPDAPPVLPAEPLPTVQTADPAVEALVNDEPSPLVEALDAARHRLGRIGARRLQADAGVARGWRFVFSSTGLQARYSETGAGLYLAAEERYARSFGKRRWLSSAELAELLDDVVATTELLRREAPAPSGELPVLVRPGLAASLVAMFVLENLSGSRLVGRRGAFTLDDFRAGRQVARESIDVVVDTLLDLEGAASPVSSDGVPGGRATLIERGRLRRPIVDLKYARRAGFPPTPAPAGSPAVLVQSTRPLREADEVRRDLAAALEVHAVLGLRGSDPTSGRYAVVAPQAQVIRAGRAIGRAKVSVSGSFFDQLLDPRTELVRYPWGLNPGLLIWAQIEPQT